MTIINRKRFNYLMALIAILHCTILTFGNATFGNTREDSETISVGVITTAVNPETDLKFVMELGFKFCQLFVT
jgi:hypothetical protein